MRLVLPLRGVLLLRMTLKGHFISLRRQLTHLLLHIVLLTKLLVVVIVRAVWRLLMLLRLLRLVPLRTGLHQHLLFTPL